MTTPIPSWLTRADVIAQTAAPAAEAAGGLTVENIEAILQAVFKYSARFEAGFKQFSDLALKLRAAELTPDAGGDLPPASMSPPVAPAAAAPEQFTGARIYPLMLNALKQASESFPDATLPDVLILAKENKTDVIAGIDEQIAKLLTPAEAETEE